MFESKSSVAHPSVQLFPGDKVTWYSPKHHGWITGEIDALSISAIYRYVQQWDASFKYSEWLKERVGLREKARVNILTAPESYSCACRAVKPSNLIKIL